MSYEKLLLRPAEVFQLLSVSKSQGYKLLATGELPSVRLGRAIRIPAQSLDAFVARKLEEAAR
jgi:excisionase family DNA binding protein